MFKKNVTRHLLLSSLVCFSIAAYAAPTLTSQNCKLGDTCPIPASGGGETHFTITPESGNNYVCKVNSRNGSLKVYITSGKDFTITEGGGFVIANPESTVTVKGEFKKPDVPNELGEIKIAKLPLFTADGTVTCYANK